MKYKIMVDCDNEKELINVVQKLGLKNQNQTLQDNTEPTLDSNNPPTDKQIYYLKKNELPIPENCTFDQASNIIGKHKEKGN